MDELKIVPSPLSGEVSPPRSKSAAHRNIICAALASGVSVVSPICHSQDVDATISAVTALGAKVCERDGAFYITGIDKKEVSGKKVTIDCGESGSTLRFMIPIAAALGVNATFIGHGRLPSRPISPLTQILRQNGVIVSGDTLPLTIEGRLNKANYNISGNISSQFLTGLIFAIAINGGTATLTTPLESAGYIDLTLKILSFFGVSVLENNGTYSAKGYFSPATTNIEADWSQACFFLSAGALGGDIKLHGLDFNSTQGDKAVIELYKKFGAEISINNNVLGIKGNKLSAIEINCSQIPDAVPALAVVAALAKGKTVITGGERLRLKETDRIKTVLNGLLAMGIEVEELPDGMIITGSSPTGGVIDGTGDHRIVMAFAILAAFAKNPTIIKGYTAINKSYPTFFEDFKKLGGKADVITNR